MCRGGTRIQAGRWHWVVGSVGKGVRRGFGLCSRVRGEEMTHDIFYNITSQCLKPLNCLWQMLLNYNRTCVCICAWYHSFNFPGSAVCRRGDEIIALIPSLSLNMQCQSCNTFTNVTLPEARHCDHTQLSAEQLWISGMCPEMPLLPTIPRCR